MPKNAASSSLWMMGLSIGEKVFAFAIYVTLARVLDILEFGIVAFCALFLDFLTMLITTGVGEYIVTRKKISRRFLNTCFFSITAAALLLIAIFSQLFSLFAPDDSSSLLEQVFMVLIFLPLFSAYNVVQIALLQRRYEFKQLAIRSMISTMLAGSISVYFAFNDYGAWALVIYKYLLVIIDSIILFYVTRFIPSFDFSYSTFKKCYRFSLPLVFSEVFNFWSSRIMELFVSIFFGPASFALLDVARKFTKIIQQVSLTALRPVCLTYISRAQAADKGKAFSAFSAYVAMTVAPLMILLGIYADSYMGLIFGSKWSEAVPIIEILSFTAVAQCLLWYFSLLLITNDKTKQVFWLNMIFLGVSLFAGVASYALNFQQYVIIQVLVINALSIFKIIYLLKTKLLHLSDVKDYFLPVLISLGFFTLIALAIEHYIFVFFATNSMLDLAYITASALASILLYAVFIFLCFGGFTGALVSAVRTIRN